eukprot:1242765-Amphidinium_carterae.1
MTWKESALDARDMPIGWELDHIFVDRLYKPGALCLIDLKLGIGASSACIDPSMQSTLSCNSEMHGGSFQRLARSIL